MMDVYEEIKNVKTKGDLIKFLGMLAEDKRNNLEEWENQSIENYLESIQSWIEDGERFYKDNSTESTENINWNFIATIFYVGKIYE